ncbi:hypothetical protein ERJ75_001000200 [Trypanosoma vivax]|uniref:Importin N-terminal domain-containing protein n=1 Tax=Trypanosoma vivax (strain Y486) TaxID=1055687 RepID=G0UAV9_TRYVY|nr:hypothetical protein ERJ75_001000200 [Trypanosoma vivax]CCC52946.1 conserved hypothetical protein [Trypanosoma vivax Y486]
MMIGDDVLYQIFKGTLSPDKTLREQAESSLAEISTDPQLVLRLIYFSCQQEGSQAGVVSDMLHARQAASIRVRNVLSRGDWNRQPYFTDDLKSMVRECIVPMQCAPHVPEVVRKQLLAAVQNLIDYDYPDRWPTLMHQVTAIIDECTSLLQLQQTETGTPDVVSVHPRESVATRLKGILSVLYACCKHYDNPVTVGTETVDAFSDSLCPSLVSLAELLFALWTQEIMHCAEEVSCSGRECCTFEISTFHTLLSDCLRTLYKCLHVLITHRWPHHFCKVPAMARFCQVCVAQPLDVVHATLLPFYAQHVTRSYCCPKSDLFDETDGSAVWKFLKWVMRLCLTLVQGHMEPKMCERRAVTVAKHFCQHYLLPFVRQALDMVRWHASPRAISSKAYILSLEVLTSAVKQSGAYREVLMPHAEELLTSLIFPRLSYSESDAELWQTNPVEYVKLQTSSVEDLYSAREVSAGLMLALATPSKSFHDSSLTSHFVQFVLKQFTNSMQLASRGEVEASRVVDAALFCVYHFASVLENVGFGDDKVEWLLTTFVAPVVAYPVGFLRARAVLVLSTFARKIKWTAPQVYQGVLAGVLPLLQDPEVPVRVQTCVSFGRLVCHPHAQDIIAPRIGELIQHYLSTLKLVDNEGVVRTLRKTIEHYRCTLSCWALQLTEVLVQHFGEVLKRTASAEHIDAVTETLDFESGQRSKKNTFSANGDISYAPCAAISIMAADEVLDTVITLVRSLPQYSVVQLETGWDLLRSIQQCTAPMMFSVLAQDCGCSFGFMDATLMLLTTILSKSPAVSPEMWRLLLCLHRLVVQGAVDYFGQMLPPLDNFICVAPEAFLFSRIEDLCEMPAFATEVASMTPAQIASVMCDTVLSKSDQLRLRELSPVPKVYDSILQNLWKLRREGKVDELVHGATINDIVEYVLQTALRVLNELSNQHKQFNTFILLFLNTIFSAILAAPVIAVSILFSTGALPLLFTGYLQLVQGKKLMGTLRSYDRRLFVLTFATATDLLTVQHQPPWRDSVDEVICCVMRSGVLDEFGRAEAILISAELEQRMASNTCEDSNAADSFSSEWSEDDFDDIVDDSDGTCEETDEEWEEENDEEENVLDAPYGGCLGKYLAAAKAARLGSATTDGDRSSSSGSDETEDNLLDEGDFVSPIDECNSWDLLLEAVDRVSRIGSIPGVVAPVSSSLCDALKSGVVQQVNDMMKQVMELRERHLSTF